MTEEKELNSTEESLSENVQEETTPEVIEENATNESEESNQKDPKSSWKELRAKAEKADQLQKERDEYYSLLKKIHESAVHQEQEQYKKQLQQYDSEEEFDLNSIDDDDLPDGKTVKKIIQQEQKRRKDLEGYIKQQQQVAYENSVKTELKGKFNDFDDVVNLDNVKKLREMRPGLARTLHSNPDIKEKAIETYYAIKDLGIYEPQQYYQDRERVKKNMEKPRSTSTMGGRETNDPLSYANAFADGLTEELKAKLYQQARKKAGRV